MKQTIKKSLTVDIKFLKVEAGVRYWEDATVNGVEDEAGTLIPCKDGDIWKPIIDIEAGQITNWIKGVTASIHYKICDDGSYYLIDDKGETVLSIEGDYVPQCLCPKERGYGDYIIMDISEDGMIDRWRFSMNGFDDNE